VSLADLTVCPEAGLTHTLTLSLSREKGRERPVLIEY